MCFLKPILPIIACISMLLAQVQWARAARTDRGVSACGNVISCRLRVARAVQTKEASVKVKAEAEKVMPGEGGEAIVKEEKIVTMTDGGQGRVDLLKARCAPMCHTIHLYCLSYFSTHLLQLSPPGSQVE